MLNIYFAKLDYQSFSLIAYATDDGVILLGMLDDKYNLEYTKFLDKNFTQGYSLIEDSNVHLDKLHVYLANYFKRDFINYELPQIKLYGTKFQQLVWSKLLELRYGETTSYGELAKSIDNAAQPVGSAVGANPIMILVPCHRVLAKDHIGGYHYGIGCKEILLNLESYK